MDKQTLRQTSALRTLLTYAATGSPADFISEIQRSGEQREHSSLQHVLLAGLGPLAYHAVRGDDIGVPMQWLRALHAADLAAQVRHQQHVDTALHVLDVCRAHGVEATLLKGICVSEQYYPVPHCRPMGDVDLLIPAAAFPRLESALIGMHYSAKSDFIVDEDTYQGAPLQNPDYGGWVELHTDVFPKSSPLRRGKLFSPANLRECTVPFSFHGSPTTVLSVEMQLIYLAAYWVRDMSMVPMHPSHAIPLLDATLLLRRTPGLDGSRVASLVADNAFAKGSLYLLLTSLADLGLYNAPTELLVELSVQRIVGRVERRILHAMLTRYLLQGRHFSPINSWHVWRNLFRPAATPVKLLTLPLHVAFPTSLPQRYSVVYQLKRLGKLVLRGARKRR